MLIQMGSNQYLVLLFHMLRLLGFPNSTVNRVTIEQSALWKNFGKTDNLQQRNMLLEVVICAETVFYMDVCILFVYISLLFYFFFQINLWSLIISLSSRCFTVFDKLHNRGTFGVSVSGSNSQ